MTLERDFLNLYRMITARYKMLQSGHDEVSEEHMLLCTKLSSIESQLNPEIVKKLISYVEGCKNET